MKPHCREGLSNPSKASHHMTLNLLGHRDRNGFVKGIKPHAATLAPAFDSLLFHKFQGPASLRNLEVA